MTKTTILCAAVLALAAAAGHYTVSRDGHKRVTLGLPGSGLYLTDRRPIDQDNFSWLSVGLLLLVEISLMALMTLIN
jgi:hypothetical protein